MVNQFTCLCQPHVLSQNHTQHSSFLVLTNLRQQDLEVLHVARICLISLFSKQAHTSIDSGQNQHLDRHNCQLHLVLLRPKDPSLHSSTSIGITLFQQVKWNLNTVKTGIRHLQHYNLLLLSHNTPRILKPTHRL